MKGFRRWSDSEWPDVVIERSLQVQGEELEVRTEIELDDKEECRPSAWQLERLVQEIPRAIKDFGPKGFNTIFSKRDGKLILGVSMWKPRKDY